MIFSVDVKFEAVDTEAARGVRHDVEDVLAESIDRVCSVSGPFEVAPMVTFEDDE